MSNSDDMPVVFELGRVRPLLNQLRRRLEKTNEKISRIRQSIHSRREKFGAGSSYVDRYTHWSENYCSEKCWRDNGRTYLPLGTAQCLKGGCSSPVLMPRELQRHNIPETIEAPCFLEVFERAPSEWALQIHLQRSEWLQICRLYERLNEIDEEMRNENQN